MRWTAVLTLTATGLALFGASLPSRSSRAPAAEPAVRIRAEPKQVEQLLTAVAPEPRKCPEGMTLIEGSYCPLVQERCTRWLDDPKLPFARCAVFANPTECLSERVPMTFCMDRYEYTPEGARLPQNHASFTIASRVCLHLHKRVCTEREWNFACEGEEMWPYPYGFERQPLCNQDRLDLYTDNPFRRILRDLREPSTERPACVSPFGIYNMVGNLDEPVLREPASPPFSSALKGGWWMPTRNRCRPATTAHDDYYSGIQVGIRCCADASEP